MSTCEKRPRKWGKSRRETSTKLSSWNVGQGTSREKKGNAKRHQGRMNVRRRPSPTADPQSHSAETRRATEGRQGGRLKQGRAAEGRGSHGTRLDSGPPARLPAPPSHRSTLELYSGGEMKSGHLQTSEHQKGQSPHTEPDNDQPPTHL